MERRIYYPGFEIQNSTWLKFALLYIDRLEPIIPHNGDTQLTDLFRKINNETDLISIHRPDYVEGERATYDAIDSIEKILKHPYEFTRIFRNNDVIKYWKNPVSHNYLLYAEKFTNSWEKFCIVNKFATHHQYGILLPTQLGQLYMTLFANIIADSKGISTITDNSTLDQFIIFSRKSNHNDKEKTALARATIDLKLPTNLEYISYDQLIKFRNHREFRQKLSAFQLELRKYLENIENGNTDKMFVNSFDNIWHDYIADVARIGVDLVSVGLGIWIVANSPNITTPEYINEVAVAGTSLAIKSVFDIRATWKNTETKRFAKKYLSSLEKLSPNTTGN